MSKQWFHSWFNSPYYHLLYRQRNTAEAKAFVNHLKNYLKLPAQSAILDVGCGRGRHACLLHECGYNVTGIDLSVANITYAQQYQKSGLQFFVHDMRQLYYSQSFNLVVNLFTSFGYFDTKAQHLQVLQNLHNALLPGGLLVLDYLNSAMVADTLIPQQTKVIDGITFELTKGIENNKVIKQIKVADGRNTEYFEEQVILFTIDNFRHLFQQSGFEIVDTFGNYQMESFDIHTAERLIFICKKTND